MASSVRCKCTVHGCRDSGPNGRVVTPKILKRHELDERSSSARSLYAEAQKLADDTISSQIDDISAHLAASTLSDQVSGSATTPGGRLWGKSPSSPNVFSVDQKPPPVPITPPRRPRQSLNRNPEKEALSYLNDLGPAVEAFYSRLISAIQSLEEPSSTTKSIVFPLDIFQEGLATFFDQLDLITLKRPSVLERKRPISQQLAESQEHLNFAKLAWISKWEGINEAMQRAPGIPFQTDHHFLPIPDGVDPILQVSFFAIIACQVIFGVALRGCNFLLNMLQYIIHLTLERGGRELNNYDQKLVSDFPTDFRRATDVFHLDPRTVVAAVCPKDDCHANYNPCYDTDSPIPIYPTFCSYKSFKGGSECGTTLLQPQRIGGQEVMVPIKRFVRTGFKDWLAGLLSCRGLEKAMDAAWSQRDSGIMQDIFDGEVLRGFEGVDGKHFSVGGDEGRYIFSLCVDYFNPLGNKQAGKKISVGLVSVVCLNLPSNLRYKPENMFLYGVIPGPSEPPLDCLNHYLTALIDELLELWVPGVRYSRTFEYQCGRLIKCALICLVCDLVSAWKTAGFVGVGANHICAFCRCTLEDHGISDTQVGTWVPRTHTEYLSSAERYKNALDQEEQDLILKETGIRWSELLRLPYFDPSRFVVVDAMHNLFLGLMKEHCEILGVRLNGVADAHIALPIPLSWQIKSRVSTLSKNEKSSWDRLHKLLESPLNDKLRDPVEFPTIRRKILSTHRSVLNLIFDVLPEIVYPTAQPPQRKINKEQLTDVILSWRLMKTEIAQMKKFKKGCILTPTELAEIRVDITHMRKPSWLSSIPADFGSARHGKLKADQWRVLGMAYLPVSLVRLWLDADIDDEEARLMRHKLLEATISLISAIRIATLATTSRSTAALYREHMLSYLTTLKEIVPAYKLHPNHHMALHLSDYLCRFGPVHSWWTFPFERVIGMLQRIPTNFKPGALEETITKSFIRSANLRALLMKEGCPEAIENCGKIFRKMTNPHKRSAALVDLSSVLRTEDDSEDDNVDEYDNITPPDAACPTNLAPSTLHALRLYSSGKKHVPTVARLLQFYTLDGRTFSKHTRHVGNSSVLVQSRASSTPKPAHIVEIIQTTSGETLFEVRCLKSPTAVDPFTQYPALGISLWADMQEATIIITPTHVLSHFASVSYPTEMEGPHFAVINLGQLALRVSVGTARSSVLNYALAFLLHLLTWLEWDGAFLHTLVACYTPSPRMTI
ncbi:hypothetical protein D9619_004081 [Psilocybe cf. subviscida]|uniref:DUF4218 domain-containing protein n=1 Tax=Psilocybe cf. subviscida TaxID=2480587 RepID=A0A8H5F8M2_9AGAR|nr:hypothetical protein D9619_004081 [Psilocybe cf. subviscida]